MEVMKKHHVLSYASYCYTEMASLTIFTTPEIAHKQGEPMEECATGTSWILIEKARFCKWPKMFELPTHDRVLHPKGKPPELRM